LRRLPGLDAEPELAVELPGADEVVGVRLDPGGDPDHAADAAPRRHPGEELELALGVDDQVPDPGLGGRADLPGLLVVAGEADPLWRHARAQRHLQLTATDHVEPAVLLDQD